MSLHAVRASSPRITRRCRCELVRTAVIVDSQPGARLWGALGADVAELPRDFVIPAGPAWRHLIEWSLGAGESLRHGAVPQFIDLYSRWCMACFGFDDLSPRLAGRMCEWLVVVEDRNHPRSSNFREWRQAQEAPGRSMTDAQEQDLGGSFLLWPRQQPSQSQA